MFSPASFHFLRPAWWLVFLPLACLLYLRHRLCQNPWLAWVSPELQGHMLPQAKRRATVFLEAMMLLLLCTALSGPTWQQVDVEGRATAIPTVLLLSLAPSMLEHDLTPDNLTRARYKIQAYLEAYGDRPHALLVYGAQPHLLVPFTDDSKTILHLLPHLSPAILPIPGDDLAAALEEAHGLFTHQQPGDIVLLTAGSVSAKAIENAKQIQRAGLHLNVIGLTKQEQEETQLAQLAHLGAGRYHRLTSDFQDLQTFQRDAATLPTQTHYSQWLDAGYWLVWPLMLLFLLQRPPALLLTWVLWGSVAATSPQALASWWQNDDQNAYQALQRGDYERAQTLFRDPRWKGVAAYRSHDYTQAIEAFSQDASATGFYNLGNALAQQGQHEAAIAAYDEALKQEPLHEDAAFNRQLLLDVLAQQDKAPSNPDSQATDESTPGSQTDSGSQTEPSSQQNDTSTSPKPTTTQEPSPPGETVTHGELDETHVDASGKAPQPIEQPEASYEPTSHNDLEQVQQKLEQLESNTAEFLRRKLLHQHRLRQHEASTS